MNRRNTILSQRDNKYIVTLLNMAKATITPEQMESDGWVKTADPIYLYEKKIENRNPINNSEDSNIKFVVHGMYNSWTFAIVLPDGGLLNFVANTMEELKGVTDRINFYDPPF